MRTSLLMVGCCLLWAAAPAYSQGWITVSEPGEWSDEQPLSVPAGTRVRVVGQAFHPQGINAIRVGDIVAQTRAGAGGVHDFEAILISAAGMDEVRIEVRPNSGDPVTKVFRLMVTGVARPEPVRPQPQPMRPQPQPQPPPPPSYYYSPGGAAVRSLILPGLGQFYTKRPAIGVAFLAAAGGALALGVASKETTIRCLAPAEGGACPAGQVHSEEDKKHMLIPGIAGFVAIGAIAAFDAYSAAKRANRGGRGAGGGTASAGSSSSFEIPLSLTVPMSGNGVAVTLFKASF